MHSMLCAHRKPENRKKEVILDYGLSRAKAHWKFNVFELRPVRRCTGLSHMISLNVSGQSVAKFHHHQIAANGQATAAEPLSQSHSIANSQMSNSSAVQCNNSSSSCNHDRDRQEREREWVRSILFALLDITINVIAVLLPSFHSRSCVWLWFDLYWWDNIRSAPIRTLTLFTTSTCNGPGIMMFFLI